MRDLLYDFVTHPVCTSLQCQLQQSCGIRAGAATNPLFHAFFNVCSSMGDELFYAIMLPIYFWSFGADVGLELVNLWMVLLVVGQICKEALQLPRPFDKRVAKLERMHETEFGLPSTHTMSGFLPFQLFYLLQMKGIEVPYGFGIALAGLVGIALARVYKGVHSIADVCAGAVLGLLLVDLWNRWREEIMQLILHQEAGWFFILAMCGSFYMFFPRPKPWSQSVATTAIIVGVWTGVCLGCWYSFNFMPHIWSNMNAPTQAMPTWAQLLFVRAAIGFLFLIIVRSAFKTLGNKIMLSIYKNQPKSKKKHRHYRNGVALHEQYFVEVPVKLLTYSGIGLSCVLISPFVCHQLGLL